MDTKKLYDKYCVKNIKAFSQKLIPNLDYPVYGIQVPLIREMAEEIEDLDFNVDEFEDAYMNLSSVSVNVGNVIRKGIFDYTLAALQGFKKTWFNCLINK